MPIGDKYINSVFSCMLNTEKLLSEMLFSKLITSHMGKEVSLLKQLQGCVRLNGTCDKI